MQQGAAVVEIEESAEMSQLPNPGTPTPRRPTLDHHIPTRISCIWLIDANAKVGEVTSSSVGNRNPDKQNMQGGLFHDFFGEENHVSPDNVCY